MARARSIKPALFKNELLGVEDPMVTLLFIGLWSLADRDGKLEDRPLRIRAEIFPYRDLTDFNGYLTVLERLEFICRYSVKNQQIIKINNFKKHQSPHKTEKASELPEPDINEEKESCEPLKTAVTEVAPLNNGGLTEVLPPESLFTDSCLLTPESINKKSKSKKVKINFDYSSWGEEPDPIILKDWHAMRSKLKAAPSQTAINRLASQIQLAKQHGYSVNDVLSECVLRGWKGFKFEWLQNSFSQQQQQEYSDPNDISWAQGVEIEL